MYNTGNPIGSTAPKDFSDNSEITDRYVNDVVNETTQDRFGRSRLTIHGIEKKAEAVIANLGFFPPVDYTTGLTVDSRNFTTTYNGIVYAAQPSAVPFITAAWDSAQWYPIQNILNKKNLLVFDTYAEASAAAATLPDGQVVVSDSDDVRGVVLGGSITEEQSIYKVADYAKINGYSGRGTRLRVVDPTGAHWWVRRGSGESNDGTILKDALGRSWEREFSGPVDVKWFGAKGDKTTDDTAALQKAINYCNSFPEALPMAVNGLSLVTSPLVINRAVDANQTDFRIIGNGKGGLYANSAITLFTSTIAGATCSEFVTFDGVVFIGSTYGLGAYVLSEKFLRIQFLDCTFDRMLCANFTTTYSQTFRFANCRIRSWEGYFFISQGSYDIDFDGNIIEHGGSLFRSIDTTVNTGSLGNRFRGNVIEGMSGNIIEQSQTKGLLVSGNYTELNKGRFIALNYDTYPHTGVSVSGNLIVSHPDNIANSSFYEIVWGATVTANSSGNVTTGRLHNNESMTGPLIVDGDVADIELFKGNGAGITDPNRGGASGNVQGVDKNSKILYITNGPVWSGIDPNFRAFVVGPGVNNAGTLVPMRFMFGTVDPGAYPASYGNPFWAIGSRVLNSNPVVGAPKGWICTASGQPGTWVSEGNL